MISGIALALFISLQIPDVGIDTTLKEGCSQSIVDNKNYSAIYNSDVYGIDDTNIICDHRTQDFLMLKYVEENDIAYLQTDSDVIQLKCIEVCEGKLDSIGYILVDGEYMEERYKDNNNVIIMYTCKKEKGKRIVTYWEVVE